MALDDDDDDGGGGGKGTNKYHQLVNVDKNKQFDIH
jgi:hypothetical protein